MDFNFREPFLNDADRDHEQQQDEETSRLPTSSYQEQQQKSQEETAVSGDAALDFDWGGAIIDWLVNSILRFDMMFMQHTFKSKFNPTDMAETSAKVDHIVTDLKNQLSITEVEIKLLDWATWWYLKYILAPTLFSVEKHKQHVLQFFMVLTTGCVLYTTYCLFQLAPEPRELHTFEKLEHSPMSGIVMLGCTHFICVMFSYYNLQKLRAESHPKLAYPLLYCFFVGKLFMVSRMFLAYSSGKMGQALDYFIWQEVILTFCHAAGSFAIVPAPDSTKMTPLRQQIQHCLLHVLYVDGGKTVVILVFWLQYSPGCIANLVDRMPSQNAQIMFACVIHFVMDMMQSMVTFFTIYLGKWREDMLTGVDIENQKTIHAQAAKLKVFFQPGKVGLTANWKTGEVSSVMAGQQADGLGVCVGMCYFLVAGKPYTEQELDAAANRSENYEVVFAQVQETPTPPASPSQLIRRKINEMKHRLSQAAVTPTRRIQRSLGEPTAEEEQRQAEEEQCREEERRRVEESARKQAEDKRRMEKEEEDQRRQKETADRQRQVEEVRRREDERIRVEKAARQQAEDKRRMEKEEEEDQRRKKEAADRQRQEQLREDERRFVEDAARQQAEDNRRMEEQRRIKEAADRQRQAEEEQRGADMRSRVEKAARQQAEDKRRMEKEEEDQRRKKEAADRQRQAEEEQRGADMRRHVAQKQAEDRRRSEEEARKKEVDRLQENSERDVCQAFRTGDVVEVKYVSDWYSAKIGPQAANGNFQVEYILDGAYEEDVPVSRMVKPGQKQVQEKPMFQRQYTPEKPPTLAERAATPRSSERTAHSPESPKAPHTGNPRGARRPK